MVYLTEQVWEDLLLLAEPEIEDGEAILKSLDAHREEYVSFYRYAEHVAQSTTLAATRPLLQKKVPRPVAARPAAPAGPWPEPPTSAGLSLAKLLVPAGVRRLIPLRLKRALAELLGG